MIQGKTAKERGQLIEYLSGSGVAFCRKVKLVVAGKFIAFSVQSSPAVR